MFNPRLYFDILEDQAHHRVVLTDKTDGTEFKSFRQGQNILRWRCVWKNSGCDAHFRTNLTITNFEGQPHLYHSNHGNSRSLRTIAIAMNKYVQKLPIDQEPVPPKQPLSDLQIDNSNQMVNGIQVISNQNLPKKIMQKSKKQPIEEEKGDPPMNALSSNSQPDSRPRNRIQNSSFIVPKSSQNSSIFGRPQIQNSQLQVEPQIKKQCVQDSKLCNVEIVYENSSNDPEEPLLFFRCKSSQFQTEVKALLRAMKEDLRGEKNYRSIVSLIGDYNKKLELYNYIQEMQSEEERKAFDIKTIFGRSIIMEHYGELLLARSSRPDHVKLILYPERKEEPEVNEISSEEYHNQ